MQTIPTSHRIGSTSMLRYEFAAAGDEIAAHEHEPQNLHFTIVARGSVLVQQQTQAGTTETLASAGDFLEFEANREHSIVAMEAGSVIYNIACNPVTMSMVPIQFAHELREIAARPIPAGD